MFVQQIIASVDTRHQRIVLTDVGSTKSALVDTVEAQLQEQGTDALSFIGGHPMAGSHETGVGAARATLFEKATCILTPTANTDADALELIKNLWEFVGAVPHLLSPKTHDLLVGAASHLPHLIASILTKYGCECGNRSREGTRFYGDRFSGFYPYRRRVTGLVDRHFHTE